MAPLDSSQAMAWSCPNLDPKLWRFLGIGALCLALLIIGTLLLKPSLAAQGLLVADAVSSPDVQCLAVSNDAARRRELHMGRLRSAWTVRRAASGPALPRAAAGLRCRRIFQAAFTVTRSCGLRDLRHVTHVRMVNCSLGADPKRPFSEAELDSAPRQA